jgi:hypothetical protein
VDLRERFGPARTISRETPELAVGYDLNFVISLYEKNGLEVKQPIHFGSWCGRSDYLSYQDLVMAIKPRPLPDRD